MKDIFRIPAFPKAAFDRACTVDPAVRLFKNGYKTEFAIVAFRLLSDVDHIMSTVSAYSDLFNIEQIREINRWYADCIAEAYETFY